ncbi:uncharacterized protein LOC132734899 [Ruditapes philippinarum]|uniref:uncharacterized protein LOC132734899 n=1 Tax=Ruditapes philippinarum TaxID=129788 RepID=UPI00295BB53A|nr:uncharacterized protein LOC132734899 [Ruditapes philippinarum]
MSWKYLSLNDNELFIQLGIVLLLGVIQGITCRKVTIVPVREDISAPLLTCWTCSHSKTSPNNDCVTLTDKRNMTKTECKLYEPFCRIQRLEADGKVEKIERSCSRNCDPGCHRYQTVKRCDSCCTQPLCNDGNDADTVQTSRIIIILGTLFALIVFVARE